MKTNLIVDLSNVAHIVRYSVFKHNKNEFSKDLLFFKILTTIQYVSNKYSTEGLLIACDAQNIWRKDLYPEYKANRKDLRDEYYPQVVETMVDIKDFFNEFTNVPAITVDRCEADDVIALATQTNINGSVIMSSDKDFIQLLDHKTRLYSPTMSSERTSDNVEYDLFVKLIRGDIGDNIPSAMPNVRETKLKAAWDDSYQLVNIMESTNKHGNLVKDDYERNAQLIDLERQPEQYRQEIVDKLSEVQTSNYKFEKFLGEMGRRGYQNIIKEIDLKTFKKPFYYQTEE